MDDTRISIRESTTTSTCPKCGFQSIPNARFCQHCGNPLPTQTSPGQSYTSTPRPYYAIQSRPGMSGGEKAVIIVALLIIILVIGGAAAVYLYWSPIITRTSFSPGNVNVIGVFLVIIYPGTSFQNNTTGYFGSAYQQISYMKYLQHNEIFTATFTLTNVEGTSHTVTSIELAFSPGFGLQSTNPIPPQTVQGGGSMTFTVTLQAPSNNYVGAVSIDLFTQ